MFNHFDQPRLVVIRHVDKVCQNDEHICQYDKLVVLICEADKFILILSCWRSKVFQWDGYMFIADKIITLKHKKYQFNPSKTILMDK
jgi:hypothetical protein